MGEDNSVSPESNPEETSTSRIRLHLTITRAHPLLLEESASLENGIRSTRILSLASIGLLVERGFFSGELFSAFEDPEVQKALMGFRARHSLQEGSSDSRIKSVSGTLSQENEKTQQSSSQAETNNSHKSVDSIEELEPGRGVKVEQSRPSRTVRMP